MASEPQPERTPGQAAIVAQLTAGGEITWYVDDDGRMRFHGLPAAATWHDVEDLWSSGAVTYTSGGDVRLVEPGPGAQ